MLINIDSLDYPGLEPYARLTEPQLRRDGSLFIVESPKVIRVAVDSGYTPVSMLCESRHVTGDAADIIGRFPQMPVYTGSREILAALTGYALTRGVLCAMKRPALREMSSLLNDARRVAVIHGVVDSTNTGAIFRSAAALGIDAVLLTGDSCDPLCRRAVRVSMGSVFLVPWTRVGDDYHARLAEMGFRTAALALTDESLPIDSPQVRSLPKLAVILGTEGDGLPEQAIAASDYTLRIPMSHKVDSLNVAAAAAVAFWELR